jgi:hypothetical protein
VGHPVALEFKIYFHGIPALSGYPAPSIRVFHPAVVFGVSPAIKAPFTQSLFCLIKYFLLELVQKGVKIAHSHVLSTYVQICNGYPVLYRAQFTEFSKNNLLKQSYIPNLGLGFTAYRPNYDKLLNPHGPLMNTMPNIFDETDLSEIFKNLDDQEY